MNKKIVPNIIEDIVDNTEVYLDEIREMNDEETANAFEQLDQFIKQYFENFDADKTTLVPIAAYLSDSLFKAIINLSQYDKNTDIYFRIILNGVFSSLSQKGVNLFYVLDNSLRDDKFVMCKTFFKNVGFDVITPNDVSLENSFENLGETRPEYTKGQSLDYKTIEEQIVESVNNAHHIIYIEKDDSVNYLSRILKLAEEFQSKYVCIFRNMGADDPTPSRVLLGSFGNILD